MIPAIILFAITYVLMLIFSKYRPFIALGSGLIFIVTGMLPANEILSSIDFNVLLMIAGTMGLVALFIESKMPALRPDHGKGPQCHVGRGIARAVRRHHLGFCG